LDKTTVTGIGLKMTFDEIWRKLSDKDGRLSDGESRIEFKAMNLKALLRQVYEQAERETEKRIGSSQKSSGASSAFDTFTRGMGL
jgi:hypothetical protein